MLVEPRRWGILALLFVSITINLLDRQVLSVLAPVIRDDVPPSLPSLRQLG